MKPIEPDLVSIIMPCYNYARFLPDAIESVARQTYRKFELIIVDDGSTDNTAEVAARYPFARYIRQNNQGLCSARNNGVRHSRGEFLVFLDPDDMLMRTALEAGVNSMKAKPECAFVSGNCQFLDASGSPIRTAQSPQLIEKDHYYALLYLNYIWNPANVMYRRSLFEAVGGFDTSFTTSEDYEIYLRIARRYPVWCHGKIVARYRKHGAGITSQAERMLKYSLLVLERQRDFIRGNERFEKQLRRGLGLHREHYGRRVVRDAYRAITRTMNPARAARSIFVLLKYYRPGLAMLGSLLARRASRYLMRRTRSVYQSSDRRAALQVDCHPR